MKIPRISMIALLGGMLMANSLPALDMADENAGIAIDQVGVLVYPPIMYYSGVYAGEVRVVISVDENGTLSDYLVTGYTELAFAEAAVTAVKRWKYQPARVHGRAQASRADILFVFKDQGVMVQTLPGAVIRHAFFSTIKERYIYEPYKLRDLDHIPTPVHVVSPSVGVGKEERSVVVEFYIDEQGKVRMAAVDRESAADAYAAAAVSAVEQWRFEPPLRKGKPVLVYAQQEFSFRPKAK